MNTLLSLAINNSRTRRQMVVSLNLLTCIRHARPLASSVSCLAAVWTAHACTMMHPMARRVTTVSCGLKSEVGGIRNAFFLAWARKQGCGACMHTDTHRSPRLVLAVGFSSPLLSSPLLSSPLLLLPFVVVKATTRRHLMCASVADARAASPSAPSHSSNNSSSSTQSAACYQTQTTTSLSLRATVRSTALPPTHRSPRRWRPRHQHRHAPSGRQHQQHRRHLRCRGRRRRWMHSAALWWRTRCASSG